MSSANETHINHEVRIRTLEKIAENIDKRFDKMDAKMDSHFHWTLGIIITLIVTIVGFFGAVTLHLSKLT